MVEIKTKTKEPILAKKRVRRETKKGSPDQKKGKEIFEEIDVVVDYKVTRETTYQPQVYRIQAEAGVVVKMVDTQTGEVAWVGSTTREGINFQIAAEMVTRRILKDIKEIWPANRH